ncbi:MAG: S1 RNA-binding domain-containing protein [Myxococcales bacterium]|nr:S1 RNA-binding domain-containing protein [Myxococcales bacterium]
MAQQDEDFAAMFEAEQPRQAARIAHRVKVGEQVEGVVVAIGKDNIFVDVGAKSEATISRDQFSDRDGKLKVGVGDRIRARVASAGRHGIELVTALGRRGGVDLAAIDLAHTSGAPIEGTFSKAVKGGLEVEIGGVRAFCPASQVDIGFVRELDPLVGQRVQFKVIEIRDNGRSVVVSRKAVMADERAERARALRDELKVGAELEGTVTSVQPYGAFIDLGGLEGLAHISELANGRVARVEDVVNVGEKVRVRVLAIEPRGTDPDDLKISLSLRTGEDAVAAPTAAQDEIIDGTVSHVTTYGVFVDTPKGRGLVPVRELDLAPGADPKRAYPAGKEVQVVVLSSDDSGRIRFSIRGVARAEERSNFRTFVGDRKKAGKGGKASGLGSLGDLLRDKLPEVNDGKKRRR